MKTTFFFSSSFEKSEHCIRSLKRILKTFWVNCQTAIFSFFSKKNIEILNI